MAFEGRLTFSYYGCTRSASQQSKGCQKQHSKKSQAGPNNLPSTMNRCRRLDLFHGTLVLTSCFIEFNGLETRLCGEANVFSRTAFCTDLQETSLWRSAKHVRFWASCQNPYHYTRFYVPNSTTPCWPSQWIGSLAVQLHQPMQVLQPILQDD